MVSVKQLIKVYTPDPVVSDDVKTDEVASVLKEQLTLTDEPGKNFHSCSLQSTAIASYSLLSPTYNVVFTRRQQGSLSCPRPP